MKRSVTIGLWLLATTIATGAAFWAVNRAGAEVSERPLTAIVAADTPSATSVPNETASTTNPVATTTVANPSDTTLAGVATSAAAPVASSAAAPQWELYTLNSGGGSIIVSYRVGEVRLESVAPAAGFSFEIKDDSGSRVEVEFEADDQRFVLRAEWTSDGFTTRIDSDDD